MVVANGSFVYDFCTAVIVTKSTFDTSYYITAAPQCPFPDQAIGAALNGCVLPALALRDINVPLTEHPLTQFTSSSVSIDSFYYRRN